MSNNANVEASGATVLSSSSSDIKAIEREMWDNLSEWAGDPRRNPLLLGWYSLCQVLAEMALPALERLADPAEVHGFPVSMYPDGVQHNDATRDEMDAAHAKWCAILAHIRDAFRQFVEHERDPKNEVDWPFVNKGMRLFGKHFLSLWD